MSRWKIAPKHENLGDGLLEARAMMVCLVAAATIHYNDEFTVVQNAFAAVDAVMFRGFAGLVTSGNVGF